MAQGLSDWEWDQLKMVAEPENVRKQFREQLEYLERFGDFLVFSDYLLAHLLAYAWRDFYRVALVCKRFHCVTTTRAYWGALAKRFFHRKLPTPILEQVNFFHMLPEEKPAYTYLQGIFKKPRKKLPFIRCHPKDIRLVYPSSVPEQEAVFSVTCNDDMNRFTIWHYQLKAQSYDWALGVTQCCEFFNYQKSKKLVWYNTKQPNGELVSVNVYCEVYDPERNQTWYGQPGTQIGDTTSGLSVVDMMPGPLSWGVWK